MAGLWGIWGTGYKIESEHDKTFEIQCTQQRLRSACASAKCDQSLLGAPLVAKEPLLLHVDSEDGSDLADVQASLSHRWAHMISQVLKLLRLSFKEKNHVHLMVA